MGTQKDFKTRDEILIAIREKDAERKRRRRSALPVRPGEDYLHRRLPGDDSIRVKVYDMGQNADGTDIDYSLYADPLTVNVWHGEAYPFGHYYRPTYSYPTDYSADFNSYILAADVDDWSTEFYRILEPTRQYGLKINGEFGQDDGDGIPITGSFSVQSPLAFWTFSGGHITDVPDPDGPAVPFSITEDFDLYLAPRIALMHGRAARGLLSGSGDPRLPRYDFFLNFLYRSMPREYFLSNETWETVLSDLGDSRIYLFENPFIYASILSYPGNPIPSPPPDYPEGQAAMDSFYNLFINDPNARNRRTKTYDFIPGTGFVPPFIQHDITVLPSEYIRVLDGVGINDGTGGGTAVWNFISVQGWFDYPFCSFFSGPRPAGLLLGAVKTVSGDKFYFWSPAADPPNAGNILWAVTV